MVSARLSGSGPARPQRVLQRGEQRGVLAGQHGARVEHDLIVVDAGDHRRVGQAQRAGELVGGGAGDRERTGGQRQLGQRAAADRRRGVDDAQPRVIGAESSTVLNLCCRYSTNPACTS